MSDNRTEKPTNKRREDARRRGQIARTPELSAIAGFFTGVLLMRVLGMDWVAESSAMFLQTSVVIQELMQNEELTPLFVERMMRNAGGNLVRLSLPLMCAVLCSSAALSLTQSGFRLTPDALKPGLERFSPLAALRRTFSASLLAELLKSLLKIIGLALVCYQVLAQAIVKSPELTGAAPSEIMKSMGTLAYATGWRAGLLLLIIAAFDYAWHWYRHERALKMTRQEVRDEYRQQEGDPAVRAQRRRAARALLQRQIATEVPRADVIVTNPSHFAVALRYDRETHAAPVVTAKGADEMARRIREIARAHQVPLVENPPLARGLYRSVEVGRAIPPEFFRAVAELLAWIYRQRGVRE